MNVIPIDPDTNLEDLLGLDSDPEDFTGEELASMAHATARDIAARMPIEKARRFWSAYYVANGGGFRKVSKYIPPDSAEELHAKADAILTGKR